MANLLKRRDCLEPDEPVRTEKREMVVFPLHAHEYFELEFLTTGTAVQLLNGTEYRLERGSLYLLSPGDFHCITAAEDARLYNTVFDESVLPIEEPGRLFGTFPFCRRVDEQTLRRMERAAALLQDEPDHAARLPLAEYLLHLCAGEKRETAPLSPIGRAALFARTHFRENPSLSDAAAVACMSPGYFGDRFKAERGETYLSYLNRCKVTCAKMLLSGGCSVTQACFDSGFGSLSGFRYVFRQHTGTTPERYKQISKVDDSKTHGNAP